MIESSDCTSHDQGKSNKQDCDRKDGSVLATNIIQNK